MKIEFKILWFEDAPDWVNSKMPSVQGFVEEHGFGLAKPTLCKKETDFKGNYNDYDLILMDLKLANYDEPGTTIISKIRLLSLTTILFYSQEGERSVRKELSGKDLDGVFCSSRDEVLEKFKKLFLVNIRKVEDVNNLRGVVMAETADLDCLMEEAISRYALTTSSKKESITNGLLTDLSRGLSNRSNKLASFTTKTSLADKELQRTLDLSNKSRLVHKINKSLSGGPVTGFKSTNFETDVIKKRNLLAHVVAKKNKDGEVVLESTMGKLVFSHEEAVRIRKDLSRYRAELVRLADSLKSK